VRVTAEQASPSQSYAAALVVDGGEEARRQVKSRSNVMARIGAGSLLSGLMSRRRVR
jgi:hypothetical protein